MRIVLLANAEAAGAAPPPTPRFVEAIRLMLRNHVSTMFEVEECCADHFVCRLGGCAPPNALGLLKPSMPTIRNMSSPCLQKGKVVRTLCLANGGLRPNTTTIMRIATPTCTIPVKSALTFVVKIELWRGGFSHLPSKNIKVKSPQVNQQIHQTKLDPKSKGTWAIQGL